jgi:alpha-L-rhamnosidase
MKAIHLRTEYLDQPLALDITNPRLYWQCEGGTVQTAYRITALQNGQAVWNSGKVESARMTHIPYEGPTLQSRDHILWKVQLWDETGSEGEGAETWFEMGLLQPDDWEAKWISGDYEPQENTRYPVDCFKKEFHTVKQIQKARLYITACGLYEAKLNGQRVGQFVLAPGTTDYRKRLQYQVYDATELIQKENTLEIQLGDGWYRGSLGAFGQTNVYGRQTKLCCQLELTYTDGARETIVSDESFRWSNDGPVRFNDLQDGEIYVAGKIPSYSGQARVTEEQRNLVGANNVPLTEHETFTPALITTPSGKKVLDFGQNIAGFVSFTIQGKRGQTLKLRMGETLDADGEFTQSNFQLKKPVKEWGIPTSVLLMSFQYDKVQGEMQATPQQEITFICGGGVDHYKTAFAIFGFRYALIETDAVFKPEDFKAIAVYSDLEQTGVFTCSNELLNRFLENTRWSMKGNFADIPTDCPTRERLGWSGDAQVFFHTASYLMDVAAFYRKYLYDMDDSVNKNGCIPSVLPYSGMSLMYDSTGSSVGWGDALILIPYRFWKQYGDESIIRKFYSMMHGYATFMIGWAGHKKKEDAKANPYNKYVYEKGIHLGEWLEPEEFKDSSPGRTPFPEECTAYLCYTMARMKEVAGALGKTEDEALFKEYENGAREAYNWLYLKNGAPDTDRQAKLVRPIALGLTKEVAVKTALESRLVKAVKNHNYHVGTGFLSTSFLLPTLTNAGRVDIAYKILENEEAPGWLYEVKAGATTVWESWEGAFGKDGSVASMNHYSPGSVCQWLFDTVAGIKIESENRFTISPIPGGTLAWASAEYTSLYGTVKSAWRKTEGGVEFTIQVPPNTTALVTLPGGEHHDVGSGRHVFRL